MLETVRGAVRCMPLCPGNLGVSVGDSSRRSEVYAVVPWQLGS